jgi:hypothetical protein
MQVIKPTKVETTYRHKETGELFKERKDWEAKGYKQEDMAQDVKVLMPSLDLFGQAQMLLLADLEQIERIDNKLLIK